MTVSVKAPTSTTGSIQLNGSDVLTIDSSGNLTTPNNLTANGSITGDGSGLTGIPAANLTGTLPALDGSNLTGISAGAWELIAEGSGTGYSNTHAFTGLGSYKFVRAYIQLRTNSSPSSGVFYCQVSANNGSSYYASNNDYAWSETTNNDGTVNNYGSSSAGTLSTAWEIKNGSSPPGLNWAGGAFLTLDFHMADKCCINWNLMGHGGWNSTAPNKNWASGAGSMTQSANCNAFKIVHSSASMSLVDYKILGVK